jgi:condensin complex subunit 2
VIDSSGEIYGAKVDRLLQDAIKVRTDLSRSAGGGKGDDGDGGGNGDGLPSDEPTRKTRAFSGNTIVKNLSTISVKKFDLEFAVDPLFRKTSAAFDQGGARGLLLNHISSQGRCQLIFDSSDSVDSVGNTEATPHTPDNAALDMTELRACLGTAFVAGEQQICGEFAEFRFQGWTADDPLAAADPDHDSTADSTAAAASETLSGLNMVTEYQLASDDEEDGGLEEMDFDSSMHEGSGAPLDALFDDDSGGGGGNDGEDMHDVAGQGSGGVSRQSGRLTLMKDNEFGWLQNRKGANKGWHGEANFSIPKTAMAEKKAAAKKAEFRIDFTAERDWDTLLGKSRASTVLSKKTLAETGRWRPRSHSCETLRVVCPV